MRAAAPRLVALVTSAAIVQGAAAAAEGPASPPPPPQPAMSPLPRAHADRLRAKLPRRAGEPTQGRAPAPSAAPAEESRPSSTSLEDMVPITLELLQEHYKNFPDPHVSEELQTQRGEIAKLQAAILTVEGSPVGKKACNEVEAILAEELPRGLDSSMYKVRCACEEAAGRVVGIPELAEFAPRLNASAGRFEAFQKRQRDHVQTVINGFLPQDFRGSLFTAAKQRSEKLNAQAVEDLIADGGSIRDRYNLLWEQQWRRRENLAMVGNATGIWKWLVRHLAGVPQPLLAFAKNINSPHGPTDALRVKFGGALAELLRFSIELNALCAATALAKSNEKHGEVKAQVAKSLTLYETEVDKFVVLLQEVIVNSPFFIKPEQITAFKPAKA